MTGMLFESKNHHHWTQAITITVTIGFLHLFIEKVGLNSLPRLGAGGPARVRDRETVETETETGRETERQSLGAGGPLFTV